MSEDLAIEPLPIKSLRPANDTDGQAYLHHDPLVALLDDAAAYDEERVRAHETSESRYQDAIASGKSSKRPAPLRLLDWSRSTIFSYEPARAEYLQQLRDRNGVARIIGVHVAPFDVWVCQQAERPLGQHLAAVTANGFNAIPVFGKMPAPPKDYVAPGEHFAFDDPARPAWTDACSRPWQQSILEHWTTNCATASIGLACGPLQPDAAFGLIALDIDADEAATVAIWREELARELSIDPDALMQRGRVGSPRVLVPIRIAMSGIERVPSAKLHGAELLGHGKQFAAFGYHVSGAPYVWTNGSPATARLAQLAIIDVDQLAAVVARAHARLGLDDAQDTSRELVERAVELESAKRDNRPVVIAKGGIVRAADTGGMGFSAIVKDTALRNLTRWIFDLSGVAEQRHGIKDTALRNLTRWIFDLSGVGEIKARGAGFDAVPLFRDTGRSAKDRARDGLSLTFGPPGSIQAGIKDQSSGAGYNAVELVVASEGLTGGRALRWLCERLGLMADYEAWRTSRTSTPLDADLAAIREQARLARTHRAMLAGVPEDAGEAAGELPEPVAEDNATAATEAAGDAPARGPETVEQSRQTVADLVDHHFTDAGNVSPDELGIARWLLVRLGTGKTQGFVNRTIAWHQTDDGFCGISLYTAPRNDLVDDTFRALRKELPADEVVRIGGRDCVIDGAPLCPRVAEIKALQKAHPGISITKTICTEKPENGGCPHAKGCRYLAQFDFARKEPKKKITVCMTTQATTTNHKLVPDHVALWTQDESPIASMTRKRSVVALSEIRDLESMFDASQTMVLKSNLRPGQSVWRGDQFDSSWFKECRDLADAMREMEKNCIITRERVEAARLPFRAVQDIAGKVRLLAHALRPEIVNGELDPSTVHPYADRWTKLSETLDAILDWEAGFRQRVPFLMEIEGARTIQIGERHHFPNRLSRAPCLYMDGTGSRLLIERALGRQIDESNIVTARPDDPPGVNVIYIADAPVAKAQILNRATGVGAGHSRIIRALKRGLGDNGLIILPKQVKKAKPKEGDGFIDYRGLRVGHLGGLAGSNEHKNVDWIYAASREKPAATDFMLDAVTLKGADLEDNSDTYTSQSRPIVMRDGSTIPAIIEVHRDPDVEARRLMATDGEQEQAVERGRAVNRSPDKPLTIILGTGDVYPNAKVDHVIRWGATVGGLADAVRQATGGWMIYGRRGLLTALPMDHSLKASLVNYASNCGWPGAPKPGKAARVEIIDRFLISLRELACPVCGPVYRVTEERVADWQIECPEGTTPEQAQDFVRNVLGAITARVYGVAGTRALDSFAALGIATDSSAGCAILDPITWASKAAAQQSPGGRLDPQALAAADGNVKLFRVTRPGASQGFVVAIDTSRHPHPVPVLEGVFVGTGKYQGKLPNVEAVQLTQESAQALAVAIPFIRSASMPSPTPAPSMAGQMLAGWWPVPANDPEPLPATG